MAVMAVMAVCGVTQGEVKRVPISGCRMPYLAGQVTSLACLSPGAAQSEPSGHPHLLSPDTGAGTAWCQVLGVPGCRGVPGSVAKTRTTQVGTSAYTGWSGRPG